jgi:hypothetical protein
MKEQLTFRVRERLGGGRTASLQMFGSASSRPSSPSISLRRSASRRLLGLPVVLAAALLALTAPSALAARGHVFKETFGTPGSGPGQLKEPSAVAVNEASHALIQSISSAPVRSHSQRTNFALRSRRKGIRS